MFPSSAVTLVPCRRLFHNQANTLLQYLVFFHSAFFIKAVDANPPIITYTSE